MFLHSIWLFLIYQTTVKPIKVIIISLAIFLSIIVLWGFCCHLCVVACWPVFYNWLDQSSLILKLFLGCDSKFSVGHIQTVHTDFLPPQVFVRSWIGCWLGVHNCFLQMIYFIDKKSPSSSSFEPSFVDFINRISLPTWLCLNFWKIQNPSKPDNLPRHISRWRSGSVQGKEERTRYKIG